LTPFSSNGKTKPVVLVRTVENSITVAVKPLLEKG